MDTSADLAESSIHLLLRLCWPPTAGESSAQPRPPPRCAASKLGSGGEPFRSLRRVERSGADGALGTATESPSRSSSVSKLVCACGLISLDELRVRSPLTSNRNPSLTSNRSSPSCAVTRLCLCSMLAGHKGRRNEARAARARPRDRFRGCRGREAHPLTRLRPAARSTSRSWRPPRGTHAACG